ncbi:MAG: sarcosine oxidase subunit gamma family protein [Rhodospirillales bacterium]|nr:sarcosine oxidase subunit gamma family protein [Rhodospirillales bacterium]
MPDLLRHRPLDGFAMPTTGAVTLAAAPPAARFILRGRHEAIVAAAAPLGFPLPLRACRSATAGEVAALWLGPDEWLILAPEAEGPALRARLEAALAGLPHALVDVGHRQGAILLAGPAATATLNAGCPLDFDPDAFPIGMCTRTVLGKTEIVLWRTGAEAFRIEAGRSFLPYVWRFLEEASREFGAG